MLIVVSHARLQAGDITHTCAAKPKDNSTHTS